MAGWIPEGEQWGIRSAKERVCNLFGLLSRSGELKVYATEQNIADQHHGLTVLVMDNAPWHKSALVTAKQDEWNQKGLYLFYLPIYSPHLNLI
ncbi:MAG: hypothetical protein ACJAVP_000922 [Spirosomataceae bacterium]|jgi:hypothetical protein